MKKETRLYNVILPLWILIMFPVCWVVVLPANLLVDVLVLLLALAVLKHPGKKAVVKRLWLLFWLYGFGADIIGAILLIAVAIPTGYVVPFQSPLSFLITLAAIALSGTCIYFFDRSAMKKCDDLTEREKRCIALTMAIVTAPWLFFAYL